MSQGKDLFRENKNSFNISYQTKSFTEKKESCKVHSSANNSTEKKWSSCEEEWLYDFTIMCLKSGRIQSYTCSLLIRTNRSLIKTVTDGWKSISELVRLFSAIALWAVRRYIIALYIHVHKMATKRGQMCELEMRAMWSLPFLDLYLGPVKRVMTIKGL